jgi:uncharacterized protein DUF6566
LIPQWELQVDARVSYQGYVIRLMSNQRPDTGEWTRNIQIWRDRGGELRAIPFIAGGTFRTRDEAVAGCIQFGRSIIDGDVPGCSVVEL